MSTKTKRQLVTFPPELWDNIFSFCDYKQLKCTLPLVCHAFAEAIRMSPNLAAKLFRSKNVPPILSGTGEDPLDDSAPKLYRVHPALHGDIAITPNLQTLCFYRSKSKYSKSKAEKHELKGKWARNRFKDVGDVCLSDCGVFGENATEPPVNKMTLILRNDDSVGGHGRDAYPPASRGKIDFTNKDGQAIKVFHVLKCISEYEKDSTFNDDTEQTVQTSMNEKGFGTTHITIFGENEEEYDENDNWDGTTPLDQSDNYFEYEMDEEEEEEIEEGNAPESYRREMDWMYVTFKREVQNVKAEKGSLTLWGYLYQ